ncbi:hypothetical protein [Thermomonospora umbrina]|uniref:Uncharacterized protein n=1 Tax=Thermomonospora umbrina TaxID=111806 RepID=A0A3D9SS12_9ACTN|nr:hypothetical protein [Thermomonospora umbrina]REE97260.1 hypothetical protein DFJ69_2725 [Thermomonospora umbrina]
MNPAHLDHEALADLAEGLLDDDEAASANAHLDDCAACRKLSAEVADVSRILADVPAPPMPAHLAARIEEALRAESMAVATVASLEHRRGRRHLRVFSAAAVTVVALGGGALVGTELLGGSLNGNDGMHTQAPAGDNPRLNAAMSFTTVSSGTHYRADALKDQVTDVVARASSLPGRESAAEPRVAGCVRHHTHGAKPVLVDTADYESREATVIVIPSTGSRWRVVVAGPACSTDVPDLINEITVPAP